MVRRVLAVFCLLVLSSFAPLMAADKIYLSVDASKPGPKIDRNIFGQFAENLGHGLYEGIWVGPDSSIPNTRGIRNDVVAALTELEGAQRSVARRLLRGPYHGAKASARATSVRHGELAGDVIDTNGFGTDEFMDFIQQIGSTPYVSVNVGSGTPEEAAEWLEYMTAAAPTALAKERAANGHPEPYKVGFLGIGNESWDCGGAMTPDDYVSLMKVYSRFVLNMNPAQRSKDQMLKIAVGPGTPDTEWTEAVMKAWKNTPGRGISTASRCTGTRCPTAGRLRLPREFGMDDYAKTLKSTLIMDEFLASKKPSWTNTTRRRRLH